MLILETIIGYCAAVIITFLQMPRVTHTYKKKSADQLSWGMIILNILASILWLTYGVILNKPPIYISNIIYFMANIIITIMKIKYKNNPSPNSIELDKF